MSAQLQPSRLPSANCRGMLTNDLRQIMAIESCAYDFPWSRGIFEDCLRMGYSNWVLPGPDDEVIGYVLMSYAVDEGHILNLCVHQRLRGQGYGQQLLNHILAQARKSELVRVLLEVRPSNTAAQALYGAAGFRQIGQRPRYYPSPEGREDAIVLAKNLHA